MSVTVFNSTKLGWLRKSTLKSADERNHTVMYMHKKHMDLISVIIWLQNTTKASKIPDKHLHRSMKLAAEVNPHDL